jgi:PAS domain S-box-containing protein
VGSGGSALFVRLVLPFLVTLLCLLGFAAASMQILSSVRAYVGGEGLWSKGQKEAVYALNRYAASGSPADFKRYEDAIAVPLGNHIARVELERQKPDYAEARRGFLQGRNDPDDIDGMIRLFRRFRHFEPIDRSIAIWTAADEYIAKLQGLALRVRAEVEKKPRDAAQVESLLQEVDRVAAVLTPLEDAFSFTLGEASRQVTRTLIGLLVVATLLLSTFVLVFARTVLRERERHQRALHESEERYRSFFETSIDAVLMGQGDGTIVAVNPAACIAFGCSEYELKDSSSDWIRGETLSSIRTALREGSRTGRFRGNLPFRRKDGFDFIGEVSSSRFTDPSGQSRISVIIRDISERMRAEAEIRRLNASLEERVLARTTELQTANLELENNNRELESFCYAVSHDLRLPLRAMNGFSELVLDDYGDVLDERAHDYLERVKIACRRMGRLIDDLLTLTRYTRQRLVPATVDLGGIAADIVDELRVEIPRRDVEVVIAPDLVIEHSDAALVRVLLRNLLSNAWKYTAEVEAPCIELGRTERDGEDVFFVRDNGCGFDMAYVDQLFKVFNRLEVGDGLEGTGIGLAIVQRIVARHGGRVWADSEPEEGATFYFTLAGVPAEAAEPAAGAA